MLAKLDGCQHFDLWPESHDLHDELAIVGIGDLEHVAAVLLDAMALIGMPALRGDPAGGPGGELQRRPLDFTAGEYAVAAAEVLVELGFRDFLRRGVLHEGILDRVHREAAEVLAQVAPGVQVPVVAVMHEALRRDFALGDAILVAVVVADEEPRASQERGRNDAEPGSVTFPALGLKDADALLDFFPGVIAAAEDGAQALDEGGDLLTQKSRLQVTEELQRGEEGVDLGGIEPEAG